MKKAIVPCLGIDADARWRSYSHTKGWVFGYKLHSISRTSSTIIVSLSADFTTANLPDNQLYDILTSSLPSPTIKEISYMFADHGYDDDHKLYDLSMDLGFQLIYHVLGNKNTPSDRLELVELYESALGQAVYSKRSYL